jgi:mycoredoxin|tara:strand:+ start:411 stop:650 length:240 start_codon:yes stop_codon:yes gene_type:complete
MSKIKVYGTTWCGDCHRSKDYLDNNNIKYDWTDVDEEPEYAEYIKTLNNGIQRVPTIVFEDGSVLVEPSNEDLEKKIKI